MPCCLKLINLGDYGYRKTDNLFSMVILMLYYLTLEVVFIKRNV